MPSERSQAQKDKYYIILFHLYEAPGIGKFMEAEKQNRGYRGTEREEG